VAVSTCSSIVKIFNFREKFVPKGRIPSSDSFYKIRRRGGCPISDFKEDVTGG